VENGRCGSRTEVVRASLRLLEDYENSQKTQRLRPMIAQGDVNIEAGRVTESANATNLANSIIK
jgi:putative addiction module CopG family antidote